MTLDDVVKELYALPPADFVPRRTALAKELRDQDAELAATVRGLPKPALSAWAVNRYARERADELGDLLDLGEQLREAQRELAGDRMRTLAADTHALVQRALTGIGQVAADGGAPLSGTLLGQVEQTLRAALADEDAAAAVRAGVLAKPLAPAGFGPVDLSGAVAVVPATRPTRAKRPVARPAADDRLEVARRAAEGALAELERAEARLEACEGELRELAEAHDAAVRRRDELRAALDEADQEERAAGGRLREAQKERERAAREAKSATEAAARAKKAVDALT